MAIVRSLPTFTMLSNEIVKIVAIHQTISFPKNRGKEINLEFRLFKSTEIDFREKSSFTISCYMELIFSLMNLVGLVRLLDYSLSFTLSLLQAPNVCALETRAECEHNRAAAVAHAHALSIACNHRLKGELKKRNTIIYIYI